LRIFFRSSGETACPDFGFRAREIVDTCTPTSRAMSFSVGRGRLDFLKIILMSLADRSCTESLVCERPSVPRLVKWIDQIARLEVRRIDDDLARPVLELIEIVARDALELNADDPGRFPLPIGAK